MKRTKEKMVKVGNTMKGKEFKIKRNGGKYHDKR